MVYSDWANDNETDPEIWEWIRDRHGGPSEGGYVDFRQYNDIDNYENSNPGVFVYLDRDFWYLLNDYIAMHDQIPNWYYGRQMFVTGSFQYEDTFVRTHPDANQFNGDPLAECSGPLTDTPPGAPIGEPGETPGEFPTVDDGTVSGEAILDITRFKGNNAT